MELKPFSVFVGYDEQLTKYIVGRAGKTPSDAVLEWLHDQIGEGRWQFDWEFPIHPVIKNVDQMAVIEEVNSHNKLYGGTFYFDSDEDRLLFCLKWMSDRKDNSIFWHPV